MCGYTQLIPEVATEAHQPQFIKALDDPEWNESYWPSCWAVFGG